MSSSTYWGLEADELDTPQAADPATIPAPVDEPVLRAVPGVPLRPVAAPATNGAVPAHTLPDGVVPTIGIDPGSKWTAAVLRVGEYAVTGWTLGPVNRNGVLDRDALMDPDNWDAFARYVNRLISHIEELVSYAEQQYKGVRVAVEVALIPVSWQPGNRGKSKLPLVDVLIPRQIVSAVIGAFPNARLVPPDNYSSRSDAAPRETKGRRLSHWGPNETVRGERDHEQAAFFVAGEGARQQ
jgi:hypothetical protein